MIMKIFVTLDKEKPNSGNINGLILATVSLTIAQVSKLPQFNTGIFCCAKPGLTKACE